MEELTLKTINEYLNKKPSVWKADYSNIHLSSMRGLYLNGSIVLENGYGARDARVNWFVEHQPQIDAATRDEIIYNRKGKRYELLTAIEELWEADR